MGQRGRLSYRITGRAGSVSWAVCVCVCLSEWGKHVTEVTRLLRSKELMRKKWWRLVGESWQKDTSMRQRGQLPTTFTGHTP